MIVGPSIDLLQLRTLFLLVLGTFFRGVKMAGTALMKGSLPTSIYHHQDQTRSACDCDAGDNAKVSNAPANDPPENLNAKYQLVYKWVQLRLLDGSPPALCRIIYWLVAFLNIRYFH